MAYSTNYSGLKADIVLKISDQSDDLLNSLDEIIMNAESALLTDLDLEMFQGELVNNPPGFILTLTVGSRLLARPAGMVLIKDIWIQVAGKWVYLKKRGKGYCEMYAPDPTVQGVPAMWADSTLNNLIFVNTPDQAYPLKLYGIVRAPGLSDFVPTTWLSTNAADLLLLKCLELAEAQLSNANGVSLWGTEYKGALAARKIELRGAARADYQMARVAGTAGSPI